MSKNTQASVKSYYSRIGTRLGYNLVMRGNKHFGYYETGTSSEAIAQQQFLDKIIHIFDLKPGMKVLDAGCGQGYVATAVAKACDVDVTGVTLVPFEVKTAQKIARVRGVANSAHFIVGDYQTTLFPQNSFDRVYAIETLSHAPSVASAIEQFYGALKPGGKFIAVEYEIDIAKFSLSDTEILEFAIKYGALHGARQFDMGVFDRILNDAGLENIVERDWTSACLPSFQRLRRLAKPLKPFVERFHLEKYFINTVVAYAYADWAEQEKFYFKVYSATKLPKNR